MPVFFSIFCNVTYNPLKNFPWFHDFSRSDPHTGFQDFPGFFQVFPGFFTFSMTNFRHSMTFQNHWNSTLFPYLFPGQTKFHTDSILFWNSMTSSHPDKDEIVLVCSKINKYLFYMENIISQKSGSVKFFFLFCSLSS